MIESKCNQSGQKAYLHFALEGGPITSSKAVSYLDVFEKVRSQYLTHEMCING